MDYLHIEGGQPLAGCITPKGNKNAALPLLAAAVLTDSELTIRNVPDIGDVRSKLELLRALGVAAEFADGVCTLRAATVRSAPPPPELCKRIRTAVLLAAPLLARFGHADIARPGGDRIGRRRLDTHLLALEGLGATVTPTADGYSLRAAQLTGGDLFLDEMSVTGTIQAVFGAVLASGHTRIANAAMEPHVQDVCRCLVQMGARIDGIGTPTLHIDGVRNLRGTEFTIGPDYMEVGSFIGLAAATRSDIRIRNANPADHRMTAIVFARLGVSFEIDGNDLLVAGADEHWVSPDFDGAVPKIDDMPWPGFPPDLISIALVVATQCHGNVLIHQKMFDGRLVFADRLIAMGAGIVQCDPHRVLVLGPTPLQGEALVSPDIRAGMALVIAALAANGTSTIRNLHQIDRGYERLEERLLQLGARIERRAE